MKQLLVFIRKEFFHVFRDRRTLLIMFGLPVVQIVLFGFALTNEVKNIEIIISDNASDINSQQITNKIKASAYFKVQESVLNYKDIEKAFRKGGCEVRTDFSGTFRG
jgi:ABC-2 type transport system permease protein